MTLTNAVPPRGRPKTSRVFYRSRIAIFGAAIFALCLWEANAGAVETVKVEPGFVTFLKLAETPTITAIGNPDIADINVEPGKIIVITGKKPGSTGLLVLNDEGIELLQAVLEVGTGRQINVSIYDGTARIQNYACTRSTCVPSPAVSVWETPSEPTTTYTTKTTTSQ